ncbi:MAG TPA: type I pullulanase [Thermotogota bacterium]|nr:type I pullulanase [Thermotogota bacterium]HPJ88697.1 type I pullulanase [Thermotogota bacterium]HPR95954.1 type I pullulanase [Thermotogota bacterium]
MKIKLSKLISFEEIICTVLYTKTISHEDTPPVFFVKTGESEISCHILDSRKIEKNLILYHLKIASPLNLIQLRQKIELYSCFAERISKNRLMKIEITDYYSELVKDVDFFPQVESDKTRFKLFSPFASAVQLKLYFPEREVLKDMTWQKGGYWSYTEKGNLHLQQYTYVIRFEDRVIETIDPFSLSLTANSERSAVIDFHKLREIDDYDNPENICDTVLYETHIRDFTSDPETPFKVRNTYKAFTQKGITQNDLPAGLDHIKELGITHLHLLPVQDFNSVDELHASDYNWGYDPKCHTVPEGSYSTNPLDPFSRIEEFSEMINTLHSEKLGVILDVVYNHTFEQYHSIFNNTLPDYAYRWDDNGCLSNGSGCGNELATERKFIRKYIVDSLKHWTNRFKIDGFRFDLMGLIDRETMFEIESELTELKKNIILYGEPWTGGDSVLPIEERSLDGFQKNHKIAVFNDELRNGLKGYPDDGSTGFVSGDISWTNTVLGSMLGDFGYEEGMSNRTENPSEQIVYSSCHDNLTLFDKLCKSRPDVNWTEHVSMNKLSAFIQLLSFGIPFLHSGEEFARSKYMHSNTYNAGDIYNSIKWSTKKKYYDLFNYYRNLIALRKAHPLFRINTKKEIRHRVNLIHSIDGAFLYIINGKGIDTWRYAMVAVNMTEDDLWLRLPETEDNAAWTIVVNPFHSGNSPLGIVKDELFAAEKSWYLLYL